MTAPSSIVAAQLAYAGDGTPYSANYDDIYHAAGGALAQAQYVFLRGNDLPRRWQGRDCFTILETGFGTGLNFLATWQAWQNDPQRSQRLHFVSTELHPFRHADLITVQQRWPMLAALAAELQDNWPPLTRGMHHLLLDGGRVSLTLLFGDASDTLPELKACADAVYLDGFAPHKNPQIWSAEVLAALSASTAPGATLASWCVAGSVRNALKALGWQVKKVEGFAHKRHMLRANFGDAGTTHAPERSAIVIGAGIAGCSMVEALSRRGWQVTLLERHAQAAQEASGNPLGLLHPMLARDDNAAARFSRAGFLYVVRLIQRLRAAGHAIDWLPCGLLELGSDDAALQRLCEQPGLPVEYVRWLDQTTASAVAGVTLASGGLWFPQGAAVRPASLCTALLAASDTRCTSHYNTTVAHLQYADAHWHAYATDGSLLVSARHVVLANAADATHLLPELNLSLRRIRGQISLLPATTVEGLRVALCGEGYVTPAHGGHACLGASFVEHDTDSGERATEHAENLQRLAALWPQHGEASIMGGRVGFRSASQDRLPLIGQLPQAQFRVTCTLNSLPRQPGLHALLGLGSRGLIWAPLGAELVAAQMEGEALPLERKLCRSLDPARFHLKHLRRSA